MQLVSGAGKRRRWIAALMATTGIALLQPSGRSAADTTTAQAGAISFNIPAQPMTEALNQFGRQAKLQTSADPALIQNLQSQPVNGRMTWQDALTALLAGSGLTSRLDGSTVVIEKDPKAAGGVVPMSPLVVEGQAEPPYSDLPEEPGGFKAEYQSSATKTPQTVKETPQAISVVTQDNMKQRQVTGLGQAIETVPGVTQGSEPGPFAGRSVTGFVTYQIRGVQTEYYYDVREDGFLAPLQTGTRDLAPYERVEVVKGPSSTLYGRGSAGGFINLVRKKPLPDFHAAFDASAGSFDYYRGEGDITGPIFGSEDARARMIVAYEDAGSFVDGVKSRREVAAPSFEFDVTESTRLLLQGTYQGDQFIPNYGVPLFTTEKGNFRTPKVKRSKYLGVPQGEYEDNERNLVSGEAQLDQEIDDDWLVTLRLGKAWSRGNQHADNYAYGALQPNGDITVYGASDEKMVDLWSGELLVNGKFDLLGGKTNLTFGAEHNDMHYTRHSESSYVGVTNIYEDNFDDLLTPGAPPIKYSQDTTFRSHGIFGQVQYRMFDRLGILLGGRYDWTEQENWSRWNGTEDSSKSKFDAFTGRAALTFDITQQITAYGQYAEIFQPNTFDVASPGGAALKPVEGHIWEAGLKTEWFEGQLGVNASIFRIERENVPIPDPNNGPGEFFSIPSGLQRADGIELEINGQPVPGWDINFGGILLDSRFIDKRDPNFGNSPVDAADWQIGLYTSYTLQSGPLQGLGLGAGLYAVDRRPVTADSAGKIDGYERVDLQIFYKGIEGLDFSFQVRNLLDEFYVESLERPNGLNHFGAPRSYLGTIRLRF
jgi:TonB-dependent siderophore receptor